MARRFVYLVTALALFLSVGLVAAQTQLPKTVSLSVVENDAFPQKLQYKSAIQIMDVQAKSIKVTSSVDGRDTIILSNGSFTVSSLEKAVTKKDVFGQLDLRFASNGDMIELRLTRRVDR